MAGPPDAAHFHLLDLQKLPSELWSAQSSAAEWFRGAATAGTGGFPANSLGRAAMPSCPVWVQLERNLAYMIQNLVFNILPVGIPSMVVSWAIIKRPTLMGVAKVVFLQLALVWLFPRHWRIGLRRLLKLDKSTPDQRRRDSGDSSECFAMQQLDVNFVIDRMNQQYFGLKWVLPRSIVEQSSSLAPSILCLAPHGLLPFGASAAASKVFGGRATRWAAAPVLFRLPGTAGKTFERIGCFPAGKAGILQCLKDGHHAGIVLDGIAGMFCGSKANGDQELWLLRRKAVVAIALQTGAQIIPGYCFGTTDACTIVDPLFGLLRYLSIRCDISLTPWFGRWWIPFGPPARVPLLMCFGDPVQCPKLDGDLSKQDVQAAVDAKHVELLEAYQKIFDTHKAAYGSPQARLSFV